MKKSLSQLNEYRYEVNQVAKQITLDVLHQGIHIYGIKALPIYYVIMLVRLDKVMIKYRELDIYNTLQSLRWAQRIKFMIGLSPYIMVTTIIEKISPMLASVGVQGF